MLNTVKISILRVKDSIVSSVVLCLEFIHIFISKHVNI